MNDPRIMYGRACAQAATIIGKVDPTQLSDPTPCTEFDVRALLSHMTGGAHRAAHVGEGGAAFEVPARVDGVADDGWPAAFDAATARMRAAWADDTSLDRPVSVPWGNVPGRAAVGGYVMEMVTHTWDLAVAIGERTELDPELGEYALHHAQRVLPAELARDEVPFGPIREVSPESTVYMRLAAWLGRAPG